MVRRAAAHGLAADTYYVPAAKRLPWAKEMLDDNDGPHLHNDPLAYNVLLSVRMKSATDPKDKVFALYCVFQEFGVPVPPPDYRKSVADIYREATVASVEYDKLLNVLYYAPSDNRMPGLASWVPDWSDPGWPDGDSRSPLVSGQFAAGGPSELKWRFSGDSTKLVITGRIVDTIMYRCDAMPGGDELLAAQRAGRYILRQSKMLLDFIARGHKIFKSWLEVSQWSDYPTGESTKEAFKRTIIMDNPDGLLDFENSSVRLFTKWYDILQASETELMVMMMDRTMPDWRQGAHPEATMALSTAIIPRSMRTLSALGDTSDFHIEAMMLSGKKCFFYTENHYFGLAPDPSPVPIQAGDKIVVFGGMAHPFLLRPVDGGYRLLTHVYVHGIMYGEAWPEREGDLEEITLV